MISRNAFHTRRAAEAPSRDDRNWPPSLQALLPDVEQEIDCCGNRVIEVVRQRVAVSEHGDVERSTRAQLTKRLVLACVLARALRPARRRRRRGQTAAAHLVPRVLGLAHGRVDATERLRTGGGMPSSSKDKETFIKCGQEGQVTQQWRQRQQGCPRRRHASRRTNRSERHNDAITRTSTLYRR